MRTRQEAMAVNHRDEQTDARGVTETACERSKRNDKDVKTRQSRRIRELGDALVTGGYVTIDQQAKALGLGRSTAWTILKANHKASGLSAAVINRMLAAPRLPPLVRDKIFEYIDEKVAGSYGHSKTQIRRFSARLSGKGLNKPERTTTALTRNKTLPFCPRTRIGFGWRRADLTKLENVIFNSRAALRKWERTRQVPVF